MKKGQMIEGRIESMGFPNKGLLTTEDRPVLVKNALPGQTVRCQIQKLRHGKAEARLLTVLKKAPYEFDEPACRHFGECGGCLYQNVPYEVQLEIKKKQVLDLTVPVINGPQAADRTGADPDGLHTADFAANAMDGLQQAADHTGANPDGLHTADFAANAMDGLQQAADRTGTDPDGLHTADRTESNPDGLQAAETPSWFRGIYGSPRPQEYRNKMEFSFGDQVKGGELTLGMHRRGSHYDIVPVPDCRIADADFRGILNATLQFFREKGVPFYHKMSHTGILRHLLVRKGFFTKEVLVDLVTTTQDAGWQKLLGEYCGMLLSLPLSGTITGILHTLNDSVADAVINEHTDILYGRDYFYEELLGLKFKITPFSFFQTNSPGAEKLYGIVRDWVGEIKEGGTVYDLYSGTGTIAQVLSPAAKKVIGVELIGEAVHAARENAKLNNISNCEFIAGDVLKVLDTLEEKPDFIVLDPPREGIHPKALGKIISYGVERMVYISCKPTSLQRDLQVLLPAGYQVLQMCCVDMFPGSGNVETVCLLSKLNARSIKQPK